MNRFSKLLSLAAVVALLAGFIGPTALFTGLGLLGLLLLIVSLSALGSRSTALLVLAGVALPVLAESYGAEHSLRVFAYPVVENFTPKLFLFALDTTSGLLLMTLVVAVLGSAFCARHLIGIPATAMQKAAWICLALLIWISSVLYMHPALPALSRLVGYGLLGFVCALPLLRSRITSIPITVPLLFCLALSVIGWTAQSFVTLLAGLLLACVLLIRVLVLRGAHTA